MTYIGFDIGGTKCAACLGVKRGGGIDIIAKRAFPTPKPWQAAVEALFRAAEKLLRAHGEPVSACGFSCGGPLDSASGVVMSPPNLPGWDNVPLVRLAEERFHAPAFLENDANACALAEWRWGAGRGAHSMAFLTFGTGLGAGLILDDRLLRGANGNAGEVGHIRLAAFGPAGYGKEGSFEGFCSGGGIAQLAVTLGRRAVQNGRRPVYLEGGYEGVTTKAVAQAAYAGDETAIEVFERCGEKLGEGLSVLVDVINPEAIVIGSVFTRCEDLLRPAMERVMARECLSASLAAVRVLPAKLGEAIGDYASLCAAEYGLSCR